MSYHAVGKLLFQQVMDHGIIYFNYSSPSVFSFTGAFSSASALFVSGASATTSSEGAASSETGVGFSSRLTFNNSSSLSDFSDLSFFFSTFLTVPEIWAARSFLSSEVACTRAAILDSLSSIHALNFTSASSAEKEPFATPL